MRSRALGVFFSCLALVVPAYAADQPANYDGFVAVGVSGADISFFVNAIQTDAKAISGTGSVSFPLADRYRMQTDVSAEYTGTSFSGDVLTIAEGAGTVHLFWRDPMWAAFGVVAQLSEHQTNSDFTIASEQISEFQGHVGVEAQYFLGNTTLYGQLAYEHSSFRDALSDGTVSEYPGKGIIGTLELRYFLSPEWMAAVHVAYDKNALSFDGADFSGSVGDLGASMEYAPKSFPVSFFGYADELRQVVSDSHVTLDYEQTFRVIVSLKYNFGDHNLLDRDRNGASMLRFHPVRPMVATILP